MKKIIIILVAGVSLAIAGIVQPAMARQITICWDEVRNNPEDIDHYNVYWDYTHTELFYDINNQIYAGQTTELCYCIEFDDTVSAGIHFAVSAVNTAGIESEEFIEFQNVGFYLVGNIVNTFNDKTKSWSEALIDNDDYFAFVSIFNLHAFQNDVPTTGFACGDPGLRSLPLPDTISWCDLDKDNNITYDDYFIFVQRYNYYYQLQ